MKNSMKYNIPTMQSAKKKGFIIYKNILASTKGITKEGTANKTVMLVIKITFFIYLPCSSQW